MFLELSVSKTASSFSQNTYNNELAELNIPNVWKCAEQICQFVSKNVNAERVMVYQSYEDWSGEVISERIGAGTESFLGLRYHPPDIPNVARALYLELKTRHLFNVKTPTPLIVEANDVEEADIGRIKDSFMRLVIYEFIDITEATRIKNSLIAAREKAISENNLRNEMMAKLFHELKTPLHGLLGLSDILRRRFEAVDDMKNKALIDSLHQSASLMRDVVEYSLSTSSLVDTVDEQNFRKMSVNRLITEVVTLVQPLADKKQVTLELALMGDVEIYAEPRGIRQVLINLIENGIKYNVENGSVTIRTELSEYGRLSVSVEDSGAGMTVEQIAKCTQPYQRFSNLDGSGLGLSIAEALMRNMGGQFEISSKVGVGTKITISMGAETEIAA